MSAPITPVTVTALYDLSHTLAAPLLQRVTYPWEALEELGEFIRRLGGSLPAAEYETPAPGVWVHKTARVAPTAYLGEGTIIGPGTEVRHGAFIRGNALVGGGCVVGNSTELKNVILFDGVQVPHYNYVGDSVLGHLAHMGAGAITSNVKNDKSTVTVHAGESPLDTGRRKVGAMLGDRVEGGCGTVLNPGAVVGKRARVYPLSSVRGYVPPDSIYKRQGEVATQR